MKGSFVLIELLVARNEPHSVCSVAAVLPQTNPVLADCICLKSTEP